MSQPRETNVWSVWPGRTRETTEEYDLEHNTTSVIWDQVPDLTNVTSQQELSKLVNQVYPGDTSNSSAVAALWDMRERIKVGDFVVMPMRRDRGSLFSVGVVVNAYRYDAARKIAFHHRPVRWIFRYMPRSILDEDVKKAIEHPPTVGPIYPERADERILMACELYEARRQQAETQPERASARRAAPGKARPCG